jgi:hypothetical protein
MCDRTENRIPRLLGARSFDIAGFINTTPLRHILLSHRVLIAQNRSYFGTNKTRRITISDIIVTQRVRRGDCMRVEETSSIT